jgi:hypothetical protein
MHLSDDGGSKKEAESSKLKAESSKLKAESSKLKAESSRPKTQSKNGSQPEAGDAGAEGERQVARTSKAHNSPSNKSEQRADDKQSPPSGSQEPAKQHQKQAPQSPSSPLPLKEQLDPEGREIYVQLRHLVPGYAGLSTTRQRVLVEMAKGTSIKGLLTFKRMFNALKRRDFSKAAKEMVRSEWASRVGRRAYQLARIMRTDNPPKEWE